MPPDKLLPKAKLSGVFLSDHIDIKARFSFKMSKIVSLQ